MKDFHFLKPVGTDTDTDTHGHSWCMIGSRRPVVNWWRSSSHRSAPAPRPHVPACAPSRFQPQRPRPLRYYVRTCALDPTTNLTPTRAARGHVARGARNYAHAGTRRDGQKKCMVPPAFHLPLSLSCTTAKHGNCSKALEATHGATQRSLHLRLAYSAMLGY
jgi:hypothetical protein